MTEKDANEAVKAINEIVALQLSFCGAPETIRLID
jgi:hypothetical protein